MKKKEYIKPKVAALELEVSVILAGSILEEATEDDYVDENVSKYWETPTTKDIWAD